MPTACAWRFRPSPADGGRTGGDLAGTGFDLDLETFIREVLQNSLDARVPLASGPVSVSMHALRLVGADKRRFLGACGWERLAPHVESGAHLQPALSLAHQRLTDPDEPLGVLVLSDSQALGLSGPEQGRGRFAMFARNKLLSEKQSDDAGGTYGVGKSVLWAASGISTVLVHSQPVKEAGDDGRPRFVGISQLPFHEVDGRAFDGPGWYGEAVVDPPGQEWSRSIRSVDSALLDALHLNRPSDLQTGTSIVVPDFRWMQELSDDDLLAQLVDAVARWYWPALGGPTPRLSVEVHVGNRCRVVDPSRDSNLRPFLHLAGLVDERPWDDAAASKPVALKLPATQDVMAGRDGFLSHPRTQVKHAFDVSVLALGASLGKYTGKMALLRGSRMVLRYLDLRADRPVVALARAGCALGDEDDHHLVEQFLRSAEPPSHDRWSSSAPKLPDRYKRGYVTELQGLNKRLKEAALELLRAADTDKTHVEVPAALRRVLTVGVGGQKGTGQRAGRFDFRITECRLEEQDGRWGWWFEGWAQSTREGSWLLDVVCVLGRDSEATRLPLEFLEVDGQALETSGPVLVETAGHHVSLRGMASLEGAGPVARDATFSIDLRRSRPRRATDKRPVS